MMADEGTAADRKVDIPTVTYQMALPAMHPKGFLATRVQKLEMTNFMRYEKQVFSFKSENFVRGNASSGKSSVIIAIFVALGQDDILSVFGYNSVKELIKVGNGRAVIKLTVSTPTYSNLRRIYGRSVQIIRKIQIEDGDVLTPIWRIKGMGQGRESQSVLVSPENMISDYFPQLEVPKWNNDSVPYIMTPVITKINLKKPTQFWYTEFNRLFEAGISVEFNRKKILETKINQLKEAEKDAQLQVSNSNPGGNDGPPEDENESIGKIKLQLELKSKDMEELLEKIKISREKRVKEFEDFFKKCCTTMAVYGHCSVDVELQEINFAVDEFPLVLDKNLIKRQYSMSSMRSKLIALNILILSFWKTIFISPIFVIERSFESLHLKYFFKSKLFYDLVSARYKSQFFITDYSGSVVRGNPPKIEIVE